MTPEEYGQKAKALEEELSLLKAHIEQDQEDLERVTDELDAAKLQIEGLKKDLKAQEDEANRQWQESEEAKRLNGEMLKRIEEFKCSAKAEECTARHMGYNLAIDDVLEILREPLKRKDEVCDRSGFFSHNPATCDHFMCREARGLGHLETCTCLKCESK